MVFVSVFCSVLFEIKGVDWLSVGKGEAEEDRDTGGGDVGTIFLCVLLFCVYIFCV